MRKSKAVPAQFVAAVAASCLAISCSPPREVRRCIDEKTGQVLPDNECTVASYGRTGSSFVPIWVYGGALAGNRLSGYSRTMRTGSEVVDSRGNTIRRAGIGNTGSGFGSSSYGG